MTLDPRSFSLVQLLESVVNLVWDRADSKGLSLRMHIDPGLPDLLIGDPLRLGQILINFTANAVKFTEAGEVVLSVERDHSAAAGTDVPLIFSVADTGIGISPEQLATLFQPFHQVDSSSRRRFQGSGLGLAICKNLAELMNGRIAVESTPGVGSRFSLSVQLPRGATPPKRAHKPELAPALPPANCKVLVVEDDALNREIVEALLSACGATVTSAPDGAAALAKLRHRLIWC